MAKRTGELALIEQLQAMFPVHDGVAVGIGDDASVLNVGGESVLVTTDMLMDGVHFELDRVGAVAAGRKCLAVNLSDIAAMAGRPTAAFVSVALPKRSGGKVAKELYEGMQPLAERYGVTIAGGDTNSWNGPLVVNVTLMGTATGAGPVLRSGAKPGDAILVTGALGGSLAGRHLTFEPRINEALALHKTVRLHAMLDLSDGLALDLQRLLDASGVGAVIEEVCVPIHPDVGKSLPDSERLHHALCNGEDFELLLTTSPHDAERLLSAPPFETRLTRIGRVTAEAGCRLLSAAGELDAMPVGGWEHGFGGGE